MANENLIKEYLSKTGQSRQELFAGGEYFGIHFIVSELIPKALKENKKIVWKDTKEGIGTMSYSFEDL